MTQSPVTLVEPSSATRTPIKMLTGDQLIAEFNQQASQLINNADNWLPAEEFMNLQNQKQLQRPIDI